MLHRALTLASASSLFLLLASIAGCDCGGNLGGRSCTTSRECSRGQVCTDGRCQDPSAGMDGGPRPDGFIDPSSCTVDEDGDGRGEGCSAGPDCDDSDPRRGGPEVCDTIDNDCDSTTDEGYADICTTCTPDCGITETPGPGGMWMPTPEGSEGVIVDDGGALTLGRTEAESFSVWVANADEGTVSKLDSRTGAELARYPSVSATAPAGTRPWNEACGWCDPARGGCIGNCPSRTAVDQNFDAYVANRTFGNQGSITKYANTEADCVDRNGNGVIDTSRDLNGDGSIALSPVGIGNEFVGPEDECILYTVAVGRLNGVPRALAIGLAPPDHLVGDVWVGLYDEQAACLLDQSDGHVVACVPTEGLNPYGAVADSRNRIWFADRSGERREILAYVDAGDMSWHFAPPVPDSGCPTAELQAYGVTVDGDGRVYVASSNCDPPLLRYDPTAMTWQTTVIPGGGTPRGLAADEMHLWLGVSHDGIRFTSALANRVIQYRLSDMSYVATWNIPTGTGPVGVGVSFDGSVWAICQGTNSAARLDPATGTWIEHGVGLTPYTYSDFIGFGLNVFAEPRGRHRWIVEGCERGNVRWQGARIAAEIPAMTEVTLWARSADTIAGLDAETWIGPFSGTPIDFAMPPGPVPTGRYLQLELRLATDDRRIAPRVLSVDVASSCEPIID